MHTIQAKVHILSAVAQSDAALREHGSSTEDILLKVFLSSSQITIVQLYVAPLLIAFIGCGSHARIHTHGIQRIGVHICLEGMHDAIASTQQHDEHEDAPCHCEARQRGAQLITAQRCHYFKYQLSHSITPSLILIILSVWLATLISCVTTTMVMPS